MKLCWGENTNSTTQASWNVSVLATLKTNNPPILTVLNIKIKKTQTFISDLLARDFLKMISAKENENKLICKMIGSDRGWD